MYAKIQTLPRAGSDQFLRDAIQGKFVLSKPPETPEAGLPRLSRFACLTESGIVDQVLAEHIIATSYFHGVTACWHEESEEVSSLSKRGKPAVFTGKNTENRNAPECNFPGC